jgi:uncharacterized protein YjbI with pentapeptide repeats
MKPKNVIVWILVLGIVALLMSTSVQAWEEVDATDILKQIENGVNVSHENVHIVGELDLSEIKLNKTATIRRSKWQKDCFDLREELNVVNSTITITNSFFENDVDFSNTQFENDVDFTNSSFLGSSYFNGTVFKSYIANFNDVNFSGEACFYDADFSGEANFEHVDFRGDICFHDASFTGPHADFRNAHFRRKADFMGAIFRKRATFENGNFSATTIFNHTEFDSGRFLNTTFTNISFKGTDFNRMEISWTDLKDDLVFNGPAYIKLIRNFREIEQFEDADAAYYQYRRLSQANKKWSFSKLMDVVAWLSCGYGVKPGFALILAFVLIMVFALVYWLGDGIRRLKENDGDNNRVSRWTSFYNSFYFSVVTFTTVGYGDWYPEDRYRIVVMIEGVLGFISTKFINITD